MPNIIPPPPPLPAFRPRNPALAKKKFQVHKDILDYYKTQQPTAPLQEQVRLLSMRGTMRRAGGIRQTINQPTRQEFVQEIWLAPDLYRPADQAKHLAEAFDYGTPKSGSVFWSGVDKNKLQNQVNNHWNKASGRKQFGSLEATTDARFMDNAFHYEDHVKTYWQEASSQYGKSALGHVTAVQVYGLSKTTIFWKDELKAILSGMNAKLEHNQMPDVIDITIVVLEPVGSSVAYQFYTNLDIANAFFYTKKPGLTGYPKNRADCVTDGRVGHASIPFRLRKFWSERGPVKPSPAALKIAANPAAVRR